MTQQLLLDLACPNCSQLLEVGNDQLKCNQCLQEWPIKKGIPQFVQSPYYWGELPADLMKEVNEFAFNHGWRRALDHYVRQDYPHIYQYVLDYGRADFAYLAPLNKQSVVLDVGSGWGTLSCLLAERVGAVYSLESVRERIEFLTIRAEQEQIKNIQPIQASFLELPVPEKSLDLVILNGVFEWIGIADDSKSPDELQLMVLHKLYDCLKPGGSLYIGIENRFGYNYFLGGKDHSDLPYTSLMPRWLADNIMAAKGKGSRRTGQAKGAYRTYTYSYWGYKSILEKAGYTSVKRYLVFPDYNHPSYIVPAENLNAFRYMVNQLYSGDTRKQQVLHKLVRITAPFGLQKIFSPCFGIYAKK